MHDVRFFAGEVQTNNVFSFPLDLTYDPTGQYYVADQGFNQIKTVDAATGAVTTIAGDGNGGLVDAVGTDAEFQGPSAVLFVPATNILYVGDTSNHVIRAMDMGTLAVTTLAGNLGSLCGWADGIGTHAKFYNPQGLAYDGAGRLFVADSTNYAIRMIVLSTVNVTTIAGSNSANGIQDGVGANAQFTDPKYLTFDPLGYLWITDYDSSTIRRMNVTTNFVQVVAGQAWVSGWLDGIGTDTQFSGPWGIGIDSAGNVVVSEYDGNRLRLINSTSLLVTTIAGHTDGGSDYVNGIGTNAYFASPGGLVLESSGLVYVVDVGNTVIRTVRYK